MVQETKRFLSYICPHCMQSVIVERDLFSLAAAPAHIKCPCGKSEMGVEFLPNRVKLTVPCLFCGREHSVFCSSRAFIREKALAFSCAASGLDCCDVGEEGPVYSATARLAELKDIAARGGVSCSCGSKSWGFNVNFSSVDLICQECGGKYRVPAATVDDIDDLCCKTSILIRGKEK